MKFLPAVLEVQCTCGTGFALSVGLEHRLAFWRNFLDWLSCRVHTFWKATENTGTVYRSIDLCSILETTYGCIGFTKASPTVDSYIESWT